MRKRSLSGCALLGCRLNLLCSFHAGKNRAYVYSDLKSKTPFLYTFGSWSLSWEALYRPMSPNSIVQRSRTTS